MATNLTTQKIKDTFNQVLHVDGGPEAAEKTVYSGTGTATALKVGTTWSATKITVPKVTDGGNAFFQVVFYITVTAGQYIQVLWLPENTAVTIDHTAAAAGPPAVPAIPSAIVVAERIA